MRVVMGTPRPPTTDPIMWVESYEYPVTYHDRAHRMPAELAELGGWPDGASELDARPIPRLTGPDYGEPVTETDYDQTGEPVVRRRITSDQFNDGFPGAPRDQRWEQLPALTAEPIRHDHGGAYRAMADRIIARIEPRLAELRAEEHARVMTGLAQARRRMHHRCTVVGRWK